MRASCDLFIYLDVPELFAGEFSPLSSLSLLIQSYRQRAALHVDEQRRADSWNRRSRRTKVFRKGRDEDWRNSATDPVMQRSNNSRSLREEISESIAQRA